MLKSIRNIIYFICMVAILVYISLLVLVVTAMQGTVNQNSNYDAIIVLGAGTYNNKPQPVLQARLEKASEIAKSNKDVKVIVSGGKSDGKVYSEAEIMSRELKKLGVAEANIILEDEATSTLENIELSSDILGKDKTYLIISSSYHLYRSQLICSYLDVDCVTMPSDEKLFIYGLLREPIAIVENFVLRGQE